MKPIKILTAHLHHELTEKDINFYKAVSALGELLVAIPDNESFRNLWQNTDTQPRENTLEQRRTALEACPDIALVFDVALVKPVEAVCRAEFMIGIDAWAARRYPTPYNGEHWMFARITQFMAKHRIPVISVNVN